MRLAPSLVAALGGAAAIVNAAPLESAEASHPKDKRSLVERDGVTYTVFEHGATGAKLEFVTNSGVCETTPGVNQYSGYLSVGTNMNMWFWFFESRNSPTTAPLAMWLNGGKVKPGCSSMIGLFQEQGPCHFVNGASTPSLNQYSWNSFANMLYVDQPIGTGFSYGDDEATGTVSAAPFVWNLLQAFYVQFPQYESRDFGLFTESYGGHYGPEFASYFEDQNAAIKAGTVKGDNIDLIALGVNNGWYDPIIQYKAYIDYSVNNSYNQILTSSQASTYTNTYNTKCLPLLQKCTTTTGDDSDCVNADNTCYGDIEGPISSAKDFDVYDVREPSKDPYPPETYVTYLQSASIQKKIGAKVKYQECPDAPYEKFANTGDDSRSFLATLGKVVNSGIKVVIWAGDADWICNYIGGFRAVNAVPWSQQSAFANLALKSYTVAGKSTGLFKTLSNLSWLQVYAAGHEVPYYQPATALQVFKQTMSKQALSGT